MATNRLHGANKIMEKLKLWSDVIATWVTIIGAFAGGLIALMQYFDKSTSERVKETLEYVDRYDKEPLQSSRSRLEDFWSPRAEKVFEKQKAGERELYDFMNSTIRKNGLEHDINLLIDFFERLRTCTCANLCDEATVRRFFAKEAYDLHGSVFPYVSEQRLRLKDKSIGVALESLAKSRNQKDSFDFKATYCAVNTAAR